MNHSETMNKSASHTGNACQSIVNMALELADVRSFHPVYYTLALAWS